MSMTIGGIALDHDLDWADEFSQPLSAGSFNRTIWGKAITQSFPISGGRQLTLAGNERYGWQKRSTVLALKALASTSPGTIHTVVLPNGSTVYAQFRHEEQPTVEFQKVTFATEPDSDFWYYGTVKMRIVGD